MIRTRARLGLRGHAGAPGGVRPGLVQLPYFREGLVCGELSKTENPWEMRERVHRANMSGADTTVPVSLNVMADVFGTRV